MQRFPLLSILIRQDLFQRFGNNAVGVVWAFLQPLLQLAMFAFVFGLVFKARIPGLEGAGFVAYLALGMWPWFAFSEGVARASRAFTDNAGLLQKVAIDQFSLVLARVVVAFGLHGLGFLLVLLVLALRGVPLEWLASPLLLLPWLWLFALALTFGSLLALLHTFVRDFEQITPILLSAMMFAAPIFYSIDMLSPAMRDLLSWNPLTWPVVATRSVLLDGALPLPGIAAWLPLAVLGLVAAAVFRRLRGSVEDYL